MASRILGIDIGYDTLKLALVQGKSVRKTAVASMPKRIIREGRIVSPDAMADLIRNTMKENGIRCSEAALTLSSEAAFVRNVTVPRMSADQLTYNLPYEFRDYITDELKNYVFDYAMLSVPQEEKKEKQEKEKADKKQKAKKQKGASGDSDAVAGEDGEQVVSSVPVPLSATEEAESEEKPDQTMELLAAAVPVAVLEEARSVFKKAGLKLTKAAPSVCSYIGLIRNLSADKRPESDEYCFLDLGYQSIRMYMFKGTRHEVTRALEFGLSRIDDAVADAYNVDVHLAHTYLLTNYDDCQNKEFCLTTFSNIAVELMRAMNFYRFSNPDSTLTDVWICGGGAAIEALRQSIAEALEGMTLHSAEELIPEGEAVEQANAMVEAIGIAEY